MNDRERISELFARPRPAYPREEVLRLLGISSSQLAAAVADGRVEPAANDRGDEVIAWEDVARLALEKWTPRMIEAALGHSAEELLPPLSHHWLIRASLPEYLIRLLDYLARHESANRHVPRNASDILEYIVREYAKTLDVYSIDAEIAGFLQALVYPRIAPRLRGFHRRCRYCGISTTTATLAVCAACAMHHEPDEHLGEYGLPELDEKRAPDSEPSGTGDNRRGDSIRRPKLETVQVVTMKHGLTFAEAWYRGEITDACTATGIVTWPDDEGEADTRYLDMEEEICRQVFEAAKRQIAEAFVRVSNSILSRERS